MFHSSYCNKKVDCKSSMFATCRYNFPFPYPQKILNTNRMFFSLQQAVHYFIVLITKSIKVFKETVSLLNSHHQIIQCLYVASRTSLLGRKVYKARDIRFSPKVGQLSHKWDKSGSFSDQISVHFGSSKKSRICPTCGLKG